MRRGLLRVRWLAVWGCLIGVMAFAVAACGDDNGGGGGGGGSSSSSGGETLTIYSSLPLQGDSRPQSEDVVRGEKMALEEAGGKAGNFKINYQSLDDSTAAIDAVTEKRVRDALAEATRSKATIIIAHRLSSLMHADEILVLEEGRVVEGGTHEELLALRGEYFDLFELQSRTAQGLSTAGARIRRLATEAAQ